MPKICPPGVNTFDWIIREAAAERARRRQGIGNQPSRALMEKARGYQMRVERDKAAPAAKAWVEKHIEDVHGGRET